MLTSLRRPGRLGPLFVLALALVAAPARADDALDQVELGDTLGPGGPHDVDKILALFSARMGVPITVDPQMQGVKVRLANQVNLTWGAFREVLDFHDIVVVEKDVAGKKTLFAHLRRNVPQKIAPPFRVVAPDAVAGHDEVVTTIYQVKHGAGNDIFATVRGLLVRDVNRVGNILYVRGPDVLIFSDFAANVRYYLEVVKALDVPAAESTTRVFQLRSAPPLEVARALNVEGSRLTGARLVPCSHANLIVAQGTAAQLEQVAALIERLDVTPQAAPVVPRLGAPTPAVAWQIAAALATVAFLGQTIILRRLQRRRLS